MIFELAILAAVHFWLYAAEGAVPDYYVGWLHFDHLRGSILFRLPNSLVIIPSSFELYATAERIPMDPVLVALAFRRVTEIVWSSSGGSDDFHS